MWDENMICDRCKNNIEIGMPLMKKKGIMDDVLVPVCVKCYLKMLRSAALELKKEGVKHEELV